jgi:hypothetical protein
VGSSLNVIKKQFIDLRKRHQYLFLHEGKYCFIVKGTLFIEYKDVKDKYEIEINASDKYPTEIPSVKEIGGTIPKEYHHSEEFLCLETPFTIWEIFRKDETLLNFVDNLILPYLLSYSVFKESGEKNFERDIHGHAHGARGILEDYKKRFNANDDIATVKLLHILAEDNYRRHDPCPCGSRKKLKKCHEKYIYPIVINEKLKGHDFMNDYIRIVCMLRKDNVIKDISNYFSEKVESSILNGKLEEKWGY